MINFLRIRNLATIEDVRLDLGPGFSILTGETGAGKSIIIDGLRLVCGEKGSADLVRAGTAEASIEAVVTRPDGANESETVIQRLLSADGSGKAYFDGVLLPLKKLKEAASGLVDVYGQNDHVFLLRLETHLDYLDAFAGTSALRGETAGLAQELRRLGRERGVWRDRERDRGRRLDFLEFQIAEIEKAGLRPGEEAELRSQRHLLKNAEKVKALVDEAHEIAYAGDPSLEALLRRLQSALAGLAAFEPSFGESAEALAPLGIAVRELAGELHRFRDRQDASPEKLEEIEARLSLIETFKRKYEAELEDIQSYLERLRAEREDLVRVQEKLEQAEEDIRRASAAYRETAGSLSGARRKAAAELGSVVERELSLLGMKKVRFEVGLEAIPFPAEAPESVRDAGLDAVEFLLSPNPGEPLKPLRRIASGGELSRVMLALKAVGRDQGPATTLVFDEVDAGIGGKTAEAVAQKLRRLSRTHQVLVITHLPQIASFAADHFRIDKRVEKDRTFTTVRKLSDEERVEEIARLLSGSRVTPAALANARELLVQNSRG